VFLPGPDHCPDHGHGRTRQGTPADTDEFTIAYGGRSILERHDFFPKAFVAGSEFLS
jgi:hypothetical protein